MKKEHWICGGADCEAPLFRRSFWLDKTERFQSARLEICGLGYFLFYINGKRISDQELMPAMTDYASVLGCETTYPVWEERSAHRCWYLSFDLLPYLKAGENVLAVRLGNGWYHQTERIAEGKYIFGLPKLWFELTLTDADGRQEWIESDRQTLWHPGGLLKNNLFLGEVRDLRKEPEGWQYPGADLPGWKPAQPVHAPETLLEEQTCPPDRVIRKLYPVLIGEYDGRKMVPLAWAKIYGDDSLLVQGYDAILRWFDYMDAHSEKGLVVRKEEGGWCLGDWCFPASEEKEQLPEAFINTFYYLHGLQEMMQISEKMNNKLPIRFTEWEKNVKNDFLDAYFDPETGDFCEGRAAGNAYGLALGLGDERTKKHLVEKYEALGRFDTGIFGTSMLLEQLFSIGAGDLAVRLLTNDSEAASFAHMKRNGATTLWERWDGRESHNHPMFGACVRLLFTQILGIRMMPAAQPPVVNPAQPDVTAPPAQALKPLDGELQPPAVPASAQHFSYEIRLSSQRQLTWAKGSIQTPDGILSVSWELLENGEKQVEWSLAPAGEDKVPTM